MSFKIEFKSAKGWETLYGHHCDTLSEAREYVAAFAEGAFRLVEPPSPEPPPPKVHDAMLPSAMHEGDVDRIHWQHTPPFVRGFIHTMLLALQAKYPHEPVTFGQMAPTAYRRAYYDCMGMLEIMEETRPGTRNDMLYDAHAGERLWRMRVEGELTKPFGYLPLAPVYRKEAIYLTNVPAVRPTKIKLEPRPKRGPRVKAGYNADGKTLTKDTAQ